MVELKGRVKNSQKERARHADLITEDGIMKLRVLSMIAAVLFPVHLAIAGERGAVNNDNRTVSAIALNDEQMDRVVAGFISIDLATELSRLPATATHPGLVPSGLFFGVDGIVPVKKG
jgi:hypothetical protein